METLKGLSYKLNIMGIPIVGLSYIYGDNMSVIHKILWSVSTLKNKSNYIFYHWILESVVMGESLTFQITTHKNAADLLNKVTSVQKRNYLVSDILYDIYDWAAGLHF